MDTDWMSAGKCRDLSPLDLLPERRRRCSGGTTICAECPVAEPASSMPSRSGSTTGSGAGSPSVSAAACSAAAGSARWLPSDV